MRPKQAWTDVATLQSLGIPAVNYGPGEPAQAHQPGEWVEGEAVAEVARQLVAFLERLRVAMSRRCDRGTRRAGTPAMHATAVHRLRLPLGDR